MTTKWFRLAALVFALTAVLAIGWGCSSGDDSGTNPTEPGDPNDPAFQTIQSFYSDADLDDSYEISSELTFQLLEAQFGSFAPERFGGRTAMGTEDSTVVGIQSYTYENGWHIFTFSAAMLFGMDTVSTLDGIDSVQILLNGDPLAQPDSLMDGLVIRAHFSMTSMFEGEFNYDANHALDMAADWNGPSPFVTLDAAVDQSVMAAFTEYAGTDSAATCDISIMIDQAINGLTFPADSAQETAECPTSGSVSTTANIGVNCTGGSSGFDSLNIDGTWTISASVRPDGLIQVSYTDGTHSWTAVDTCYEDDQPVATSDPLAAFRDRY